MTAAIVVPNIFVVVLLAWVLVDSWSAGKADVGS